MSGPEFDVRETSLVREAAEWRLLALLFERPRPGWTAELAALASEVEAADLRAAAEAAMHASEGFHLAYLGNGGPVSPREVGHRPQADPGRVLCELRAFYEAFRFEPQSEEPLDHVSREAGFLGYLRLKQAFARVRADPAAEASAGAAAATFLAEHLAHLSGPLARGLAAQDAGYLALAARALEERTGPSAGPNPMPGHVPEGPGVFEGCAETCALRAPGADPED